MMHRAVNQQHGLRCLPNRGSWLRHAGKEAVASIPRWEGIDDKELATPSKIGGVLVQQGQITPDELSAALWLPEMGGKRGRGNSDRAGRRPPGGRPRGAKQHRKPQFRCRHRDRSCRRRSARPSYESRRRTRSGAKPAVSVFQPAPGCGLTALPERTLGTELARLSQPRESKPMRL